MRHFYIIFLLSLPVSAEATTHTAPDSVFVSRSSFLEKQGDEKRGFLKKFIEKRLIKRLKKVATRSGDGDGKWLSISGFAIGLLGILPWVFSSEVAAFVSFTFPVIGLMGLLLSILGLIKARSWNGTGIIKGAAIAGIVLNGLLIALGVWGITQL
jgi:VIT1/CCC1 family predicted Fe2+/Mn2+ transporter